jgi:hypothetical protein
MGRPPSGRDDSRAETEDRAAVNQKDANRPGATLRATREYQPANRREDNITRRRRFTSCPLFAARPFDEKLET